MRPCPACGRKIQDAAQHCHYCGAVAPPPPKTGRPAPVAPTAPPTVQAKSHWLVWAGLVILALTLVLWYLGFRTG